MMQAHIVVQDEFFGMDKPLADNILTTFDATATVKTGYITLIKEGWGILLWAYF